MHTKNVDELLNKELCLLAMSSLFTTRVRLLLLSHIKIIFMPQAILYCNATCPRCKWSNREILLFEFKHELTCGPIVTLTLGENEGLKEFFFPLLNINLKLILLGIFHPDSLGIHPLSFNEKRCHLALNWMLPTLQNIFSEVKSQMLERCDASAVHDVSQ